jgi:hypothetical protein
MAAKICIFDQSPMQQTEPTKESIRLYGESIRLYGESIRLYVCEKCGYEAAFKVSQISPKAHRIVGSVHEKRRISRQ